MWSGDSDNEDADGLSDNGSEVMLPEPRFELFPIPLEFIKHLVTFCRTS